MLQPWPACVQHIPEWQTAPLQQVPPTHAVPGSAQLALQALPLHTCEQQSEKPVQAPPVGLQPWQTPLMQESPLQQPPMQLWPSPWQLAQLPPAQVLLQHSLEREHPCAPDLQEVQVPLAASQIFPAGQEPVPHWPPQPSGPHCLPLHWGEQWQVPSVPQSFPEAAQLSGGHLPLQPSSPQTLPPHCGVQATQAPAWHFWPGWQLPHVPPQPLSPHTLLPHCGVHCWHCPVALQVVPFPQLSGAQRPPQPSSPQILPRQLGAQTHWPAALHCWPVPHGPQLPPQPSVPQTLLVQSALQITHWPPWHFWPAPQ